MTFFLAQIRRIFLTGVMIFIIGCACGLDILGNAYEFNSAKGLFCTYLLFSILFYIIFNVLSCFVIRQWGQFAEVHKKQSLIKSIFRCLWHDIISPFNNIVNFFGVLIGKNKDKLPDDMYADIKKHTIERFFWMMFVICVHLFSMYVILF